MPLTSRACCRAGIYCSSSPEPLLIKDIKVRVNKQKPKIECPAQMKHNSDKMTIAPMSCQPCSKPDVSHSSFPSTLSLLFSNCHTPVLPYRICPLNLQMICFSFLFLKNPFVLYVHRKVSQVNHLHK